MLKIPKCLCTELIRCAESGAPYEVCGLIGGIISDGAKEVTDIYPLENIDRSREHFSIDVHAQLDAVRDMRKKGITPLGNFHSHPASPPIPSREDIRLAHDEGASYVIISLAKGKPVIKSFRVKDGEAAEEAVVTEEGQRKNGAYK